MAKKVFDWNFNINEVFLDYFDNEGNKIAIEGSPDLKKIFEKNIKEKNECYLSLQDRSTYEFFDIPLSEIDNIFCFNGYKNGRPNISINGKLVLDLTPQYSRKISKSTKDNGFVNLEAAGFGSNKLLLSFDDTEFSNIKQAVVVTAS